MGRLSWVLFAAAMSVVLAGCASSPFLCRADSQCVGDDGRGVCQATGFCSFADATCGSGQRYAQEASNDLSGACVVATSSSSDTQAGTGPGDSPASTTTASNMDTTAGSTMPAPSDSESSATVAASSGSGSSSSGGGSDSSGTATTGPGTSTGANEDPYGQCMGPEDCPLARSSCLPGEVCAPPCDPLDAFPDCPAPIGASTFTFCMFSCQLSCMLPEDCPAGMECANGQQCVWVL